MYEGGGEDEAELRRERIQHLADPCGEPAEIPEVDVAEFAKRYDQAFEAPTGYPQLGRVDPEMCRRGPVTRGEAAYSAGYGTPGQPVPIPSATLTAGAICRPVLAEGQSRSCAPGG
jgi:hypothetical protein